MKRALWVRGEERERYWSWWTLRDIVLFGRFLGFWDGCCGVVGVASGIGGVSLE